MSTTRESSKFKFVTDCSIRFCWRRQFVRNSYADIAEWRYRKLPRVRRRILASYRKSPRHSRIAVTISNLYCRSENSRTDQTLSYCSTGLKFEYQKLNRNSSKREKLILIVSWNCSGIAVSSNPRTRQVSAIANGEARCLRH